MKFAHRTLSMALALALALMALFTVVAGAAGAGNVVGGRHQGMTWSFDPTPASLTVSGRGKLPSDQPMPWHDYKPQILAVIFRSGITEIPDGFLTGCVNMTRIFIPASVTSVGAGLLTVSKHLTDIIYEGNMDALLAVLRSNEDRNVAQRVNVYEATLTSKGYEYTVDGMTIVVEVSDDGRREVATSTDEKTGEKVTVETNLIMEETLPDGTHHYKMNVSDNVYGEGVGDTWKYPNGDIRHEVEYNNGVKTSDYYDKRENTTTTETVFNDDSKMAASTKDVYKGNINSKKGKMVLVSRINTYRGGNVETEEYKKGKLRKKTLHYADGAEIVSYYDKEGMLTGEESYENGVLRLSTKYRNGFVLEIIEHDEAGNASTWKEYNDKGVLLKRTSVRDGKTVTEEYDDNGKKLKSTEVKNGQTVTIEYGDNEAELRRTTNDPDGSVYIVEYNAEGKTAKNIAIMPDGARYEKVWQANGTLAKEINEFADGVKETIDYNANGRKTKKTTDYADGTSMIEEYQADGTYIATVSKPDADGFRHYEFFTPDGTLDSTADLKDGMTGTRVYYNADGTVFGKEIFTPNPDGTYHCLLLDADDRVIGEYNVDADGNILEAVQAAEPSYSAAKDRQIDAPGPLPGLEEEARQEEEGQLGEAAPAIEEQPAEQPAAEQPAAEQPAAEQPAAEQPAAEQPVAEQPVAEQPAAEQPAAEQPVAEQPVAEQPVAEQPVAEQPAAEQPAMEQPAAEQPAMEQPAAEQPAAEQPAAEQPAAEQPAVEQPAAEQPAVEQPAEATDVESTSEAA